jgi:hypothetical protein
MKARLLCVWEQGGHLGHLALMRLPIEVALRQGYDVFLAARELHAVHEVLGGLPMTVLPAPFKQRVASADQSAFLSYTHLIGQQCFSTADELAMYVRAWRAIFDLVQPKIVLFEHSPTALVAAHAYHFKKVLLGSSFTLPPASALGHSPFLPFPTTVITPEVAAILRADDAQLLGSINSALERMGLEQLANLAEIYGQVDANFLCTWPVLDQFGERAGQRYLGSFPPPIERKLVWPSFSGQKVFGYLQYFPAIESLLRDLQTANVCAVLRVSDLPTAIRQKYSSDSIHFLDHLVDLGHVAQEADWVLHHGNHSTMATFLLAGTPQMLIPRHQEQLFSALRMVSAGCAAMAFQDQAAFGAAIHAMKTNAQLKQCCVQLASQCTPFDHVAVSAYVGQTYDALVAN